MLALGLVCIISTLWSLAPQQQVTSSISVVLASQQPQQGGKVSGSAREKSISPRSLAEEFAEVGEKNSVGSDGELREGEEASYDESLTEGSGDEGESFGGFLEDRSSESESEVSEEAKTSEVRKLLEETEYNSQELAQFIKENGDNQIQILADILECLELIIDEEYEEDEEEEEFEQDGEYQKHIEQRKVERCKGIWKGCLEAGVAEKLLEEAVETQDKIYLRKWLDRIIEEDEEEDEEEGEEGEEGEGEGEAEEGESESEENEFTRGPVLERVIGYKLHWKEAQRRGETGTQLVYEIKATIELDCQIASVGLERFLVWAVMDNWEDRLLDNWESKNPRVIELYTTWDEDGYERDERDESEERVMEGTDWDSCGIVDILTNKNLGNSDKRWCWQKYVKLYYYRKYGKREADAPEQLRLAIQYGNFEWVEELIEGMQANSQEVFESLKNTTERLIVLEEKTISNLIFYALKVKNKVLIKAVCELDKIESCTLGDSSLLEGWLKDSEGDDIKDFLVGIIREQDVTKELKERVLTKCKEYLAIHREGVIDLEKLEWRIRAGDLKEWLDTILGGIEKPNMKTTERVRKIIQEYEEEVMEVIEGYVKEEQEETKLFRVFDHILEVDTTVALKIWRTYKEQILKGCKQEDQIWIVYRVYMQQKREEGEEGLKKVGLGEALDLIEPGDKMTGLAQFLEKVSEDYLIVLCIWIENKNLVGQWVKSLDKGAKEHLETLFMDKKQERRRYRRMRALFREEYERQRNETGPWEESDFWEPQDLIVDFEKRGKKGRGKEF